MALTELIQANPRTAIIIISILVTLFSTLVTKWLTNQEHLKELKKRQKEIQGELKKCKDNECKMKELNAEILQITGIMMKSSFKPMFVTMIPFLILIYWIRSVFDSVTGFSWFWWYLGSALVFSMIFRKLFKMA